MNFMLWVTLAIDPSFLFQAMLQAQKLQAQKIGGEALVFSAVHYIQQI